MADISVDYKESDGSCTYNSTEGGRTGSRIFTVDWADAFQLAKELRGGFQSDPGSTYATPAVFPYADDLFCSEVAVEGFGVSSQSSNEEGSFITYDKATVIAKYAKNRINFNPADPTAVEQENITISAEMATLANYEYTADSVALEDKLLPSRVESTTGFSVTKFALSFLPGASVAATVGKINSNGWRGYTAEYVLFIGADASRTVNVVGAEDWEVTYNFLTKSHSWNQIYRDEAGHGHYEAVRTKSTHAPIYALDTFSALGV